MSAVREKTCNISKKVFEDKEQELVKAKENEFSRMIKRLQRKNQMKRNQTKQQSHLTNNALNILKEAKRLGLVKKRSLTKRKRTASEEVDGKW